MYWYIQVCTNWEFLYWPVPSCTGTYWYVPVRTISPNPVQGYRIPDAGTYQYVPPCTALYQGYRIPDGFKLSNGRFLNLGATCFRTEWRARANFRRLLLLDSPSSQPPSLHWQKFNFGTDLPTRCTNYSVLPESRFWHTSCTLGFKMGFKLVDIFKLGSEMPVDTSWEIAVSLALLLVTVDSKS